MKKISICIPCYNEEKNIPIIYNKILQQINKKQEYKYEIIFADNASSDNSLDILRELAKADSRVKVIVNQKNFGPMRSQRNCIYRSSGDAIIGMACDLQEPPELIEEFITFWEKGNKVVWGQKLKSNENKLKYLLRKIYYKVIDLFSEKDQIKQVTGFGLLDREVVEYIKDMDEIKVPVRNLMPELGFDVKLIPYVQDKRINGKSSYNISKYFDFAMHSFIYTSRSTLRLATLLGICIAGISFLIGVVYLIYKLINWNSFQVGMAPLIIGVFFLGAIQLFFIGILGEYLGNILEKLQKRPLVVEKELINFD